MATVISLSILRATALDPHTNPTHDNIMPTLILDKMHTSCPPEGGLVEYSLTLADGNQLQLNELLGKELSFSFRGTTECIHCHERKVARQGSCWNCLNSLACNDLCIMKPETCHYAKGTCREPQWGEKHCFSDQTLYLSRSAGIKIGITRGGNHMTRWADQGAIEAMVIGTFSDRLDVGLAEKAISTGGIGDRTSWQKMLKNDVTDAPFDEVLEQAKSFLNEEQLNKLIPNPQAIKLEYPHLEWPKKVKSMKFDKMPYFSGTLTAIKGQYLIFGDQVINIRSHAGYCVELNY